MVSIRGKEEMPINAIKEVLLNDVYGQEVKLEAVKKLKDLFKPPDRIFSKVKIESLLQGAGTALVKKIANQDFLFKYGSTLAGLIGSDPTLHSELLYQMEYVLVELKKLDESLTDKVNALLWSKLEEKTILHCSGTLNSSKQTVENMVLDWMDTTGDLDLEFPARMAAASKELFQSITAILYELVVRSHGHTKILQVTQSFIRKVMSVCEKEGWDFLGLYPNDCHHLVALLMADPKMFPGGGRVTVNQVNFLLSEMFLNKKYKVLILLSHYSAWVHPFRQYLNKTGVI